MQNLEKVYHLLATGIKISTRNGDYYFYMFIDIDDTFKLIEQLTNFAIQKWANELKYLLILIFIQNNNKTNQANLLQQTNSLLSKSEEFKKDILPQLDKRTAQKVASQLKRDLDAKAESERFR